MTSDDPLSRLADLARQAGADQLTAGYQLDHQDAALLRSVALHHVGRASPYKQPGW